MSIPKTLEDYNAATLRRKLSGDRNVELRRKPIPRLTRDDIRFIKQHYTRGIVYIADKLPHVTYNQIEYAMRKMGLHGYSEYCRRGRKSVEEKA